MTENALMPKNESKSLTRTPKSPVLIMVLISPPYYVSAILHLLKQGSDLFLANASHDDQNGLTCH